ncbi:hypothetical protein EON80_27360 [bacterium]|nr:MAG: hypothetical protein EON80_27360 [bacterium]
MVFIILGLGACRMALHKDAVSAIEVPTPKNPPRLVVDGKTLSPEKTRQLIWETPIMILRPKKSVMVDGRELQPHLLRNGESIYVHSHRAFWSPRASGQAFFDTFLFGCRSLPPSPLDRVVNEGVRLEIGDAVLIEEYPDRVATPVAQDFALIRCTDEL